MYAEVGKKRDKPFRRHETSFDGGEDVLARRI
jgi:hypothetical protein